MNPVRNLSKNYYKRKNNNISNPVRNKFLSGANRVKEERYYYTYISTNQRHTVLYTGVSNNLLNRNNQHKEKINKRSFTARYNVDKLVYYETFADVRDAIAREKQIKAGSRKKKIELIESINPEWKDLSKDF